MGEGGVPAPTPAAAVKADAAPHVCPSFHAAVELIGRRWTGAILFALIERPLYFRELAAAVPGLSDRLLSARLRELEAEGLVERCVHDGPPARVSYALTELGRGLEPAIRELHSWARRWDSGRENGSPTA
jgi:DNA-binding HxlR family transcriptional regulator